MPIRKKSGNLFNDPRLYCRINFNFARIYIYIYIYIYCILFISIYLSHLIIFLSLSLCCVDGFWNSKKSSAKPSFFQRPFEIITTRKNSSELSLIWRQIAKNLKFHFVRCCFLDLIKTARNILVLFPSSFFSMHFVSVHTVVLTYSRLWRNPILFHREIKCAGLRIRRQNPLHVNS